MRDLGSAAGQRWAVPEAYGDIGAAADPGRAVANGLHGNGLSPRAVGRREPPPEGRQDSLDGPGELKGLGFLADTAEGAGPLHFLVPNPGLLGRWPMWIKQLARITPPLRCCMGVLPS